ncbi:MAG TPA: hypothetical protein PLL21_01690 [Sedimentibacter sp.]|nr:hypothetical protein [Sedimentibacter sp.]
MYRLFPKIDYLNIEEVKLLNTYRYLSWILTSIVYYCECQIIFYDF